MAHTSINTIPNTATNLEFKMPVFNAARSDAAVTEKTLIRSNTTQLDVETQDLSLPAAQDNTTARVIVTRILRWIKSSTRRWPMPTVLSR